MLHSCRWRTGGRRPPRTSNVGKYQNGTSYTRVSARHKWTRLVLLGTPWLKALGEDRSVEESFVPLWISRCKTRNFRRRPLFLCFYMFRWNNTVIPGLRELREPGRIRRKTINEKITSSTVRSSRIPRGAVESVTISVWSVGGSNPVRRFSMLLFFFPFFFVLFLYVRLESSFLH